MILALPRARQLPLAGVMIYLAFLIATLPASVASWFLSRWTDNAIRLQQTEGTFWRGTAGALQVTIAPRQSWRLSGIDWDVVVWRLLKGELTARVRTADQKIPISATLSYGGERMRVQDADARLPANDVLLAFWPQLSLWQPGGQFRLITADFLLDNFSFDQFPLNRTRADGEAELSWINASSSLSKVNPLGNYHAAISAAGDKADYQVTTLQGALQIEGRGVWSAVQGINFNGTARTDSRYQAQLSDLLKLFGKEQAPGVYRVTFSGKR